MKRPGSQIDQRRIGLSTGGAVDDTSRLHATSLERHLSVDHECRLAHIAGSEIDAWALRLAGPVSSGKPG